jgi:2-methylcitrate synthase
MKQMFKSKQLVMGFGHRMYKSGDPRHSIIKSFSRKLADSTSGNKKLYQISECIEQIMIKEKNIFANLDFFSASVYSQSVFNIGSEYRRIFLLQYL